MNVIAEAVKHKEAVFPWNAVNQKLFPEDMLGMIYDDLRSQSCADIGGTDLLREILHESDMNREEFIDFLENCILLIFVDLESNRYVGFGYVTDITRTETHLRGFGGYCFHRKHWNIKESLIYGKLFVAQLFNYFGFDQLWGLSPVSNRQSRLWLTRLGCKYLDCKLPGFTTYHGKRDDTMVCYVNKDEFNKKWGFDDNPEAPVNGSGA
jgi:hypothetical protein